MTGRRLRLAARVAPFLALALALLLEGGAALARVGGGESFGGGERSGGGGSFGGGGTGGGWRSSGGGGWGSTGGGSFGDRDRGPRRSSGYRGSRGGGDGPAMLAAIPVVLLVLWLVFRFLRSQGAGGSGAGGSGAGGTAPPALDFAPLRERDPGFSEPLLIDLANLIFARAHEARTSGDFGHLRAYLGPAARLVLGRCRPVPVRDVVIGASRVKSVHVGRTDTRVEVEFEANLKEGEPPCQRLRVERWLFVRRTDAPSPGPGPMQALRCPSCGAASETNADGTCAHCQAPIADGSLQWRATVVNVLRNEPVEPPPLAPGSGLEEGTDRPTVVDPGLTAALAALSARDPGFGCDAFTEWARAVFLRLQAAWAGGEWERARPFETDAMFQVHRLWVERYRTSGLTNHIEGADVTRVEPVKLTRDASLEAFTVRIHAQMRDWTTDRAGKVVSGDAERLRLFTEYWTFVRTAGCATAGSRALDNCPSCGAALDRVDLGGVCGYCDTKIAGGEHGWVLSAITQDEVYAG